MEKGFICVVRFLRFQSPLPPKPVLEKMPLGFQQSQKRPVSGTPRHGTAKHGAASELKSIRPCVEPHVALSHMGAGGRGPATRVTGVRGPAADKKWLLCLEVYILRFYMISVAMPTLATNLFPGMTGNTQTLLGMRLSCLSPSLPPSISGNRLGER